MMQTLAIFHDAYRELNAKRLFWIVLGISGIVVAAFGAVGLDPNGLTILWFKIPSELNSTLVPVELFYKLMFANLGVKYWLNWIAAILALVSTASMIPDFVVGGSIELTLSKPIGRLRLYFTKYAAGLLFVTLQVLVFTVAGFLVIGLRGKTWIPGLFWAVPYTVAMFSFVFCVCALLGLLTRSTIASLLLTLLLWFGLFAVHSTEQQFLLFRTRKELQVEKLQQMIANLEKEQSNAPASPSPADSSPAPAAASAPASAPHQEERYGSPSPKWAGLPELEKRHRQLEEYSGTLRTLTRWHRLFYATMIVLPKTSDTIDLLERRLVSDADLKELQDANKDDAPLFPGEEVRVGRNAVTAAFQAKLRDRSELWILGTSFAFEGVVLLISGVIFARRDF